MEILSDFLQSKRARVNRDYPDLTVERSAYTYQDLRQIQESDPRSFMLLSL